MEGSGLLTLCPLMTQSGRNGPLAGWPCTVFNGWRTLRTFSSNNKLGMSENDFLELQNTCFLEIEVGLLWIWHFSAGISTEGIVTLIGGPAKNRIDVPSRCRGRTFPCTGGIAPNQLERRSAE